MNCDSELLLKRRQEEVKRLGGQEAFTSHALRHLRLKTVIKESHGTAVQALCFNQIRPELNNLFVTVGKDQATVYDDQHMNNFVAVVVHFTNRPAEHAAGGELSAVAWLHAGPWVDQPDGDACLAVAGADANVSIISVAEARVVRLLRGHAREVVELATCAAAPRVLLSLARDGNLRLWDVPSEVCLASIQTDATSIALAPDGSCFVTGNPKGRLHRYELSLAAMAATIQEGAAAHAVPAAATTPTSCVVDGSRLDVKQPQGNTHSDAIDCIGFLPGGVLATKSTDGRMFVWRLGGINISSSGSSSSGSSNLAQQLSSPLHMAATWKVPGCHGGSSPTSRSRFGTTPDGRYVAVGNNKGDCYVYDVTSGARVTHVTPVGVSAPVRACGLSADGRHLLAAIGKGFIFRFEYPGNVPPASCGRDGSSSVEDDKENADSDQIEVDS